MPQTYKFLTVEDARDAAINETIGSSSSSLTALQDKALTRQIDQINRKFIIEGHIRHPSSGWSWMEDTTIFQTKNNTTLNGAITTSTTTVILTSGTDFDSSGRIWIRESGTGSIDFVDYTGKSTHNLTGATNIDISHADDQKVEKAYAIPSDMAKVIRMIVDSQEYFPTRESHLLPTGGHYDHQGSYFVMPENIGTKDVSLWYQKSPLDLYTSTASTDNTATDLAKSIDVPDSFFRYVVEYLKAYIWNVRRREEKIGVALDLAEAELSRALSYDITEAVNSGLTPSFNGN